MLRVGVIVSYLYSVWNQIVYAISNFRIQDIIDIVQEQQKQIDSIENKLDLILDKLE